MALAFDQGQMFAFDKAAGEACRHLSRDFRCAIHAQLPQAGCRGCGQYDCLGAGQRVVNEVFAGQNWRDNPALKAPMIAAFARMRQMHELLSLLEVAARLPLSPDQRTRCQGLQGRLTQNRTLSIDALRAFEQGSLGGDVARFMKSLKPLAANIGKTR